jgi:uncharacterized membrane protein YfcA
VTHLFAVAALGVLAGVVSGLLGVGGGIVFVPVLTIILGLDQHEAEATSLAAVVPVVLVGAWQQSRVGLVRWRPAVVIGLVSVVGVLAGAAVAGGLSNTSLAHAFGVFLLFVAGQMAWRARPGR